MKRSYDVDRATDCSSRVTTVTRTQVTEYWDSSWDEWADPEFAVVKTRERAATNAEVTAACENQEDGS